MEGPQLAAQVSTKAALRVERACQAGFDQRQQAVQRSLPGS